MSRKIVFCVVSVVALITLAVSAQQQAQPGDRLPGELAKPGTVSQALTLDLVSQDNNPFWHNGIWDTRMGMNQEEMRLKHESEELVKQLGKAEGDNKEKIRTKLTETLGKQFDARQKRHEGEIAALEAKIKKLKDMVQKRQDNRREIISRRQEQLVREADGLGW
jgi:hypothetical protein